VQVHWPLIELLLEFGADVHQPLVVTMPSVPFADNMPWYAPLAPELRALVVVRTFMQWIQGFACRSGTYYLLRGLRLRDERTRQQQTALAQQITRALQGGEPPPCKPPLGGGPEMMTSADDDSPIASLWQVLPIRNLVVAYL
jgi:hypothetical protein